MAKTVDQLLKAATKTLGNDELMKLTATLAIYACTKRCPHDPLLAIDIFHDAIHETVEKLMTGELPGMERTRCH